MSKYGVDKEKIQKQASYLLMLATTINNAANDKNFLEEYHCRKSGTIKNLAPELAKGASAIKKML